MTFGCHILFVDLHAQVMGLLLFSFVCRDDVAASKRELKSYVGGKLQ